MNSKIKRGLGRGLSSLIGETKVEPATNKLSLSEIVPNRYQPRKNFDKENLEDLTNSIKERGVIQPIIVRKSKEENEKFVAHNFIGKYLDCGTIKGYINSSIEISKLWNYAW